MSRMFCISCGIPVVVDPDGRCPEGHDVAAFDDAGSGDQETDGAVDDAVDDEPAPWIADVPATDDGPDAATGHQDSAPAPAEGDRPDDELAGDEQAGDGHAGDDLAGDLLLPDTGGAQDAPRADAPGGEVAGDGSPGDAASVGDTHRFELAAELASLLDDGDATGGDDEPAPRPASTAGVEPGAAHAGRPDSDGPDTDGPEADGLDADGPDADDTQPIVRRVVSTSPVHPDAARGAVIDTTNFTARGERVGAAGTRPGLWARLTRRRVS